MTYRRIAWLRLSALIIALIVLAGTGFIGIYNAFDEWTGARTLLQKTVTGAGVVYGILGLIAATGLLLRKRWSVSWAIAWAVVVTYAGSVAVTVYGEAENAVTATLGAFAGCVVVAGLTVWLTAVGSRRIVSDDNASS